MTYIKNQIQQYQDPNARQEYKSQKETMNHAMWHDEHEHVILMQCIEILVAYKVGQEALQVLETWDATTLPTYKGISPQDSKRNRRAWKLGRRLSSCSQLASTTE